MIKFGKLIASTAVLALGAGVALGQDHRDAQGKGRPRGDAATDRQHAVPYDARRGDQGKGRPQGDAGAGRQYAAPYDGRRGDQGKGRWQGDAGAGRQHAAPYDGRRDGRGRGREYGYRVAPGPGYYYPYGVYTPPARQYYIPGYVEYPVYDPPVYITREYVYPAPPVPQPPPPIFYRDPPTPPPPPPVYYREPPLAQVAPPPPPAPPTPAPAPAPAPAPQFERYTLSAKELFEFDSNELRRPQPKLDEIAAALKGNPQIGNVDITGYTDRLGTDAYNLKLSQQRADAVKAYLVASGVAADRLNAVGRGESNPVVQCKQTARAALIACLEPNRRVEVAQITVERQVPRQ